PGTRDGAPSPASPGSGLPGPEERDELARAVERAREAGEAAATLRGRLGRRPALGREMADADARAHDLDAELAGLRDRLHELAYQPDDMEKATRSRDEARAESAAAAAATQAAQVAAAGARARADAAVAAVEACAEQHRRAGELGEDVRHVSRAAELLGAFRNAVVGSVGPRLSAQAAELFAELTDHEYDRLEVDPETYEIQIRDQGHAYGMDRFSGSETDLANLALRVAISEQIRFQSGGAVGLLVLDEVFGPLDDERKERMLLALDRLQGRFRQVLVVTHDGDIKEQLPGAIEVVKLPGRRATARVL
ncbi:MAG: SbcC/MukB-like Walker B domain-containing protein, partial [Acidimicrobiales bacterium]